MNSKHKASIFLKRIAKKLRLIDDIWTRDWLPEYQVGVGTYGRPEALNWGEKSTLTIGSYCSIAPNVEVFLGGEHRPDWVTTYPFNIIWKSAASFEGTPKAKGDVVIGNDVWIGRGAVIMSGVTVGDGAVIGSRAIVSKNVAPYAIVVGSPAREIKRRFDQTTIDRLLKLKWWDWDKSRIQKFIPLLLNTEIGKFLDAAEKAD